VYVGYGLSNCKPGSRGIAIECVYRLLLMLEFVASMGDLLRCLIDECHKLLNVSIQRGI
jgi:hypothetical protein